MATFVVGVCEEQPIKNAPAEVESALASKAGRPLAKQDVAELLLDHGASSLCLTGYTCDADGVSALCECIAQSLNLSDLSLRGVKPDDAVNAATVCVDSLVENLSVQRVDVGDCGMTTADVARIAEAVIPWNRTVVDWDFSGNGDLGDEGANAIVDALIAATSSVQRLNLRGTGVTDVAAVCKKLEQLTCLYQVDVSANPGQLSKEQATSLHAVLMNNAALLRPGVERTLKPLVAGAGDGNEPAAEEKPAEAAAPPPAEKKEEPKKEEKPASPTRPRGASRTTRPRGSSRAASPPPKEKSNAAAADNEKKDAKPANNNQQQQQQQAASPEPAKQQPAEKKEEPEPSKPAEKPAEKQQQQQKQQPAQSSQQRQRTSSPAPARSSSAHSTQRARSGTYAASPGRGRSPAQRDVNDGVEEWRKKRNEYNNYIRAASPAAASRSDSPSRRGPPPKPKFVLGKRVDDNPKPMAAFTSNPTRARERAPTPAEVRKFAPWNQKTQDAAVSVGGVTRVVVEEGSGAKPATVVTFVDGGRQTYLEEDPRDMGYQARKIQTGAQRPTGSLYRSNTPRDLRFGTSFHDRGYVQPVAQGPGPGFYTVESEWEKKVRLARERARAVAASGKPMFSGSAAPRPTGPQGKDMSRPGPGEYEIP